MIRFGDFELDAGRRELRKGGSPVDVRERALDVLVALTERAGQVVSQRDLCRLVWPGREVDENNLQVEIARLRRMLGRQAIVTASGRGYQFALPVDPGPQLSNARSALIGRDDDLAALDALLVPGALVTLTGEGGIGKSALAGAVAGRRENAAPLPTAFIALDAADSENASMLGDLRARLVAEARAGKVALVVMDGCDALVQPAAALTAELFDTAPRIAVLATSREVLRAPGERVYRLGPLGVEAQGAHALGAGRGQAFAAERDQPPGSALQLFARTLAAAGGEAEAIDDPGSAMRARVAALCRELDGNPLAIVLAAQRAAEIGVETLASRLAESLDVLVIADAGGPPRLQSVRASLDWSLPRLTPFEQRLYRDLAAVAQPFSLENLLAARQFARTDQWELMEALTRLVEKSMVAADRGDPPHYRLSNLALRHARSLAR